MDSISSASQANSGWTRFNALASSNFCFNCCPCVGVRTFKANCSVVGVSPEQSYASHCQVNSPGKERKTQSFG